MGELLYDGSMEIVTDALVDRVLAIEIANLESRLAPYAALPGNPSGIHIERFGGATAFVAAHIPVRLFNTVMGVSPETADHFDAMFALYDAHGATCALEIAPSRMTEPFGLELVRRGFVMVEFHTGLVKRLDPNAAAAPLPEGVTIEVIDPRDEPAFERFLDTYLEGWGAKDIEASKRNMRTWRDTDFWRFYLAAYAGEPAGAAILDVRGDTAMLGSASTKPALRGHRVQGALLQRRIADAAAAGAELLVGGAYFGTTSMRNQQRAGLELIFTRGVWVRQK